MTNFPLISVVMPAYNHEQFVQRAIRSVMEQDYPNIELLVTNDGSTDATWQKINELKTACEKRFTRVVFATQPNQGTCRTFNELTTKAQGEFVAVIASDDELLPGALSTLGGFLAQNPNYVLAVGDNCFLSSEGDLFGRTYPAGAFVKMDSAQNIIATSGAWLQRTRPDVDFNSDQFGAYASFLTGNYIPNGYLIRRQALEQTGKWTPEAPLEDWYIMMQLAKLGKFKYFDKPLFGYRIHTTNTIFNYQRMAAMSQRTFLYEIRQVLEKGPAFCVEEIKKQVLSYSVDDCWGARNLLAVCKRKNKIFSVIYLSVFGKEFLLYRSPRLPLPKGWKRDKFYSRLMHP